VLALLLANGAYFAWSQGLLRAYGYAPASATEPLRIAQQVRPENLLILSAEEVRRLEASPLAGFKAAECLQAGLFSEADSATLRSKLDSLLPAGSWSLDPFVEPARWIVYMGKYPTADALAKKRVELAQRNVKFENVTNPALEFGLSLGGYDTLAAADNALDVLTRRGIKTARVVQDRFEVRSVLLKIAVADEAIKARLDDLKPALAGKALRACR
jgi:hypothetical protein